MNRTRAILVFLAVLVGGAATALGGPFMSQYWNKDTPDGIHWGPRDIPDVPTVQGPWGQPVPVTAPYNIKPPNGTDAARAMLAQSMPLDLIQQSGYFKNSAMPILPVGGQYPGGPCPGGVCPAPGAGYPPGMMPPGQMIAPPGISGVPPGALPPGMRPPGAVAAVGALTGHSAAPFPVQRTEVRFVGPAGMQITWYGPTADGKGGFSAQYLEAPASYNFLQASIYRLKLSHIPNRAGLTLYPTLEVVPAKAKTCTFLAHSAVPITFTEEDFEQVAAGNFVVKVIYLPDPQFQDLAATGPDEVVSSRLQPGVDPIVEAQRRGSILLVVRLGNINLEAPNTPAMDAPNPFRPHAAGPQGVPGQMPPGMIGRPPMVPPGMANGRPMLPATPEVQANPGLTPPGQMLPLMPGTPSSYPAGTQSPGQPGTPLSQTTPPSSVQQTQYQQTTIAAAQGQQVQQGRQGQQGRPTQSPPKRRPTLAELAGQLSNWGSSDSKPPSGSR